MQASKVGLALSGGGARGIAHIGVLKALEELNLRPSIIAGVSSGAIVGACYSAGYKPSEILSIIKKVEFRKYIRFGFRKNGLINSKRLLKVFKKYLGGQTFEDLSPPLYVGTVDLHKGTTHFFDQGPIIRPVLASCAIPILFSPVVIEDKKYVDGGVLDNLPIEPIENECDFLIGVNVNPVAYQKKVNSYWGIMERTFHLVIRANIIHRQENCDWFIEPPALSEYGGMSVKHAEQLVEIGYNYVMENQPELHHKVK